MSSFVAWVRPVAPSLLSLALVGCPAPEKPTAAPDAAPAKVEVQEDAIELPKIDGPVARVNGADVASDKFLHEYEQALRRYKNAKRPVNPAFDTTLRQNIVRRLIEAEVIAQKAKELGVAVDDAELEKEWTAFKARYGSPEAFQGFLERAVATESDLREQHRLTTIRGRLFTQVAADVKVEPAEVQAEYEANKIRYKLPERVKLSHIFIRLPKGVPAEMVAERKKLAEDVLKRAKKAGADFAQLAKDVGEDETKARGGDLGFITRGAMPKPFEDVAFKLSAGQLGLAETDLGFHVMKVDAHEKERQQSFQEVKEQIETSLRLRRQNQKKTETQREWMQAAKIEWIFVPEPKEVVPAMPQAQVPQPASPAQIQRAMAPNKNILNRLAVPGVRALPNKGPSPTPNPVAPSQ
ncbi:MAG: peptidylprolyl isomerase [Deltaproteobacteria bacterium]|nr:peptidylprolyl isomerase [Deltaproteobacteria bacterium]